MQTPVGVQLFLLMYYFALGNVYWTFNLQAVFCLFETLKIFYLVDGMDGMGWGIKSVLYPPKGRLLADSCRGPIGFTYVLFWVSKSLEAFQFTDGFLQKKNPENVLPPQGTSACRLL